MRRTLLLCVLLSSCATTKSTEVLHPTNGVINLARAAYLKGCVDSRNIQKVPKPIFVNCRELSDIYADEIEEMLTQKVKIVRAKKNSGPNK